MFDLFAIATGLEFWHKLIVSMYDVTAWYWNILWLAFIVLGAFVFALGIRLIQIMHVHAITYSEK